MEQEASHKKLMERLRTCKRCVNLDWLEIHAREPIGEPHNAEYFRSCGCWVEERDYGTPIYREMFVIYGSDNLPAIEVRRNPKSSGLNGIHDAEETHIRIKNRLCYYDDTAEKFENWLNFHHYNGIRISRVDICLDFVRFDFGDDPWKFIRRYVSHKYAKYCGGDISLHGKDGWDGINLNSLKWGNPKSIVSTKLYNKTLELKESKTGLFSKPYIRQAWLLCGFIDDMQHCTFQGQEVEVWRLEYSIKSSKRGWAPIDIDGNVNKKYSLKNTLEMYQGRDKLLALFASLTKNYFHFKKYKKGQRKDRCPDKKLFDFSTVQQTYKLTDEEKICGDGDRQAQRYNLLSKRLWELEMSVEDETTKEAIKVVIDAVKEFTLTADMARPWNAEEKAIMRAKFVGFIMKQVNDPIHVQEVIQEALKVSPKVMDYVWQDLSKTDGLGR